MFARNSVTFWLRRSWPLLVLLAAIGCTKPTAVQTAQKKGAQVEWVDKYARNQVKKITFPAKAGDDDVAVLEDAAFSDVTEVDLSGTHITDDALKYVKSLKKLAKLNLNNTNITDAGLAHL
ncbi:MAG: hypothetical protein ACE5KM_23185, partial [Planctomycetaceae bacterium]